MRFVTRARMSGFLLAYLVATFAATRAAASSENNDDAATRSRLLRSITSGQLVGKPVTDDGWEHVARIERVLIHPENGRVTFVVLSFTGEGDLVAVPWSALSIDPRGRAHLTVPRSELANAPRIYGPPQQAPVSLGSHPERPASSGLESDGGPSRPAAAASSSLVVEGTLTGTMVAPLGESSRKALAIVDTGRGTLLADLGPQSRLNELGVELLPGAPVTLAGALKVEGGSDVLVVYEVLANGKRVRLRGANGEPRRSESGTASELRP